IMSRLLRVTFVVAPSTSKTRELPPLISTRLLAGPWIVRLLLMTSSPLVRAMPFPAKLRSKTMGSPLLAAAIAARSESEPLSLRFMTVSVLGSQRSSRVSRYGRKDWRLRVTGSLRVRGGPANTWLAPGGLEEGSGADHADGAVVEGRDAEVVEVGPERGGVAAHDAVRDRQRPGSAVEEAAACRTGGVAGQGALLECGRGEVVDGSAAVTGRVGRETTAADRQRPEGTVVDPSAGGGRVAGENTVTDRHGRPSEAIAQVIDG